MAPKIIDRPRTQARIRQRAIQMFRDWDASMIRRYGQLYYRKMDYTVH